MPFEKGHKPYPGAGTARGRMKELRSLALHIRDGVDPAELRDRLLSMARGRDPATGDTVSVLDQQRAMQMLFDRGWGQAAQHVVIEGEIRNEHVIAQPPRKTTMTLDEINERRAKLRALGIKPKTIDVEAHEVVEPLQLPSSSTEEA